MTDIAEIESAIDNAISALGLAKIALAKSAIPALSERDVLRKGSRDDVAKRALDMLAEAERRMSRLEAGRDLNAQHCAAQNLRDSTMTPQQIEAKRLARARTLEMVAKGKLDRVPEDVPMRPALERSLREISDKLRSRERALEGGR